MKRALALGLLKAFGWSPVGEYPNAPKSVLVIAPHTSNWDFVILIVMAPVFGVKASWIAKKSLFRPPLGWFMRKWGGMPVERGQSKDLVAQLSEQFRSRDELMLGIPVEGTRGRVEYWKSGFYHIAKAANVPLVCVTVDYKKKEAGFGPTIELTDSMTRDMDRVREFYEGISPRFPEKSGPIRLRAELD